MDRAAASAAGGHWTGVEKFVSKGGRMMVLLCILAALLAITLMVLFARPSDKKVALISALLISVSSAGLYALWGSPLVVEPAEAYNAHMDGLQAKITENSERIKQNPNDLEAWLTMAQAFSDAGDYVAAANGFKQAVLLSKGDPRIIMAYAESLILQQGGVVTMQAKKSIDIALMLDKDMPIARYYQAVWLLQEERNDEAMEMMKTLYAELPEDSKLKQRMKAQIGR